MKKLLDFAFAWLRPSVLLPLFCSFFYTASAQVYLNTQLQGGGNTGDAVTAGITVAGFNDVLGTQFSITWDPAVLDFDGITNFALPTDNVNNNFNINNVNQGALSFLWVSPNLAPLSLADCTPLFTINFTRLSGGAANINFSNTPLQIEIVDNNGVLPFEANAGPCVSRLVEGKVYNDTDSDCLADAGEAGLSGWFLSLNNGTQTFTTTSNATGSYQFFVADGTYSLSVIPPNALWSACQNSYTVQVNGNNVVKDCGMQSMTDCPLMEVQVAVPSLRPCFDKVYQVKYCNNGTVPAVGASVQVDFDPYMTVLAADIPWSSNSGNTYQFPLGTVGVGECGSFGVKIKLDCNATVGLTHCVSAHIFPDANCFAPDPLWDGADLQVQGTCTGNAVQFTIKNIGAAMNTPTWYNVIKDGQMAVYQAPLQLSAGEVKTLEFPANGTTWRVEAGQSPFHPGNSQPSATVEACGLDGQGTFSLGYYTQYPQDDADPFIDIDCRESINSFDPNDKQGFPKGFCDAFVSPSSEMEYTIRFQNTGSGTAYEVILLDTLPAGLEPTSLRPGPSSHPYSFSLKAGGVAEFRFANINLPHQGADAEGSQGFVQFRIAQRPSNPDGTSIENRAAIYFDLNAPVITNLVQNKVQAEQLHQSSPVVVTHAGTATSNDGSIKVGNMAGGVPPYAFTLDGQAGGPVFDNLAPGDYDLLVTDANGCQLFNSYVVSIGSAVGETGKVPQMARLQPNLVASGSMFSLVFLDVPQTVVEVRMTDAAGQAIVSAWRALPLAAGGLRMVAPERSGVYFVEVIGSGHTRQLLRLVVI